MISDDDPSLEKVYKFIHFRIFEEKEKTNVYICCNNKSGGKLGFIKWHGPWRQYCFFPECDTVFNKGCLNDVNDFIKHLMNERG